MNLLSSLLSLTPDVLYAMAVYVGAAVRSGRAEKVPPISALLSAFVPAFVTYCVLILLHYAITQAGYDPPVRVIAAVGGLLGYLGNKVTAGVELQGKRIEDGSAIDWIISVLSQLKPNRKP